MEEKDVSIKTNKKKVIIALIALLIVVIAVVSYALWIETKKQTNKNSLITACLDISYNSLSSEINADGMWPTPDSDSVKLTPYSFSITNNCETPIYYTIALESTAASGNANYIPDEYIKLRLDNGIDYVYNDLDNMDNDPNAEYQIRNTKQITDRYVGPHSTNVHEIRLWLDEDTPVSEMNKIFKSKVRLVASQELMIAKEAELSSESCFTVDSNGVLTAYDTTNCPMNNARIVIPPKVNGVTITAIGTQIFGTIGAGTSGKKVAYIDLSHMTGLRVINACAFGRSNASSCTYNYNPDDSTGPLIIPYGVTTIGDYAFGFYKGTNTDLIIPNTVETIGKNAFYQFVGDSVQLSTSLQSIGQQAFNAWKGLAGNSTSSTNKSVLIIPDSVTTIDRQAFPVFRGDYLKLSNNLTSIGVSAFTNYVGTGTELEIPSSITTIEQSAFMRFNGDNIIFNNGLVTIGNGAFYNYKNGPINLPSTLQTIDNNAFYTYNYANVTIPASVTTIGSNVFAGMKGDKTINILSANPGSMTLGSGWSGSADYTCNGGACPF